MCIEKNVINGEELLEGSELLKCDYVVELLTKTPELILYKTELEVFCGILKEQNYLKRTLVVLEERILLVMSALKQRPCLINFMKDYISVRGEGEFSHHLSICTEEMLEYSNLYITLTEELKKAEQDDWNLRSGFKIGLKVYESISDYDRNRSREEPLY